MTYEYQAFVFAGIKSFNTEVAKLVSEGWEFVNGAHGGMAIYAFMRRPLTSRTSGLSQL